MKTTVQLQYFGSYKCSDNHFAFTQTTHLLVYNLHNKRYRNHPKWQMPCICSSYLFFFYQRAWFITKLTLTRPKRPLLFPPMATRMLAQFHSLASLVLTLGNRDEVLTKAFMICTYCPTRNWSRLLKMEIFLCSGIHTRIVNLKSVGDNH